MCTKELTLFLMVVSAPDLVNILTVLQSPFSDAMCKRVHPSCNNDNL